VAVANAVDAVKSSAHYVTRASGGRGAVREFCELVLRAQGQLAQAGAV
jgi:3-deoxy-D-manno-octulosonate 8-phosphate phosphatase (KDO 8-P phosphatase)